MKLIHKQDSNNKLYNELYNKDKLIRKVEASKRPEYKLLQKVYIGGNLYIVTEIADHCDEEIILTVEFEDFEDYLDKIYVTKCEDGEYRTLKEQKEMKASEYAMQNIDFSKNRAWIIDKDKSKEFIELFEAHKNSEKRKKFLDECVEVYEKMMKNGGEVNG